MNRPREPYCSPRAQLRFFSATSMCPALQTSRRGPGGPTNPAGRLENGSCRVQQHQVVAGGTTGSRPNLTAENVFAIHRRQNGDVPKSPLPLIGSALCHRHAQFQSEPGRETDGGVRRSDLQPRRTKGARGAAYREQNCPPQPSDFDGGH
jgi:hypothetical protein